MTYHPTFTLLTLPKHHSPYHHPLIVKLMPLIMRPPAKTSNDMVDPERLRQTARRKEQNRNAQRRLRVRREEHILQLQAQLEELHRRSQSQEEESHFLREALALMRAENRTLAEQIAMIHQAFPSTQSSHPLQQRASIRPGADQNASLNFSRSRSQSVTASMIPPFAFGNPAAPWSTSTQQPTPAVQQPFGATDAPSATHRTTFSLASPLPGAPGFVGGLAGPKHDNSEDVVMPRSQDASRTSSISPASQRRDSSIISPFDLRSDLSRLGSGQTELTLPSEPSEVERGTPTKFRRTSDLGSLAGIPAAMSQSSPVESTNIPSRTAIPATRPSTSEIKTASTNFAPGSDDVTACCLESIHSLPQANVQKRTFDNGTSWMSQSNDDSAQLALSDLSTISKSLALTPVAMGLTNAMTGSGAVGDGWSISPWINMPQTPSDGALANTYTSASRAQADGHTVDTGMAVDGRKSLASRRGFSGSLKFEANAV